MKRYRKGKWAEYYAALYLAFKGYRILKIRYKTRVGEIDLICKKKNILVCVEVKYRSDYTKGVFAIQPASQKRIRRAAEHYMMENQKESSTLDYEIRMDAVIVTRKLFVHHIKNAF